MANGQLDVAPTQGNLLRLQDQLDQMQSGHDLLDRKREVLVQRLMDLAKKAEAIEEEMRKRFAAAHAALREARMRMGTDRLRRISLVPTAEVDAVVRTRSIMGARVPDVQLDVQPIQLPYGLGDTSAALDVARERWLEVLRHLGELAEVVTTALRLAQELRKTRRRVNALESMIIPQYENTVNFIEQALEEEQREDITRFKRIKAMQQD